MIAAGVPEWVGAGEAACAGIIIPIPEAHKSGVVVDQAAREPDWHWKGGQLVRQHVSEAVVIDAGEQLARGEEQRPQGPHLVAGAEQFGCIKGWVVCIGFIVAILAKSNLTSYSMSCVWKLHLAEITTVINVFNKGILCVFKMA